MLNSEFFDTVEFNCDVSDANYWGFFSICGLLLRLRTLFKIERNLDPWDSIPNEEIFPWIEKKEEKWKTLNNAEFQNIKIDNKIFPPFEANEINNLVNPFGVVYGAGYALFMKPTFFIGTIKKIERINSYKIYFVDREIVRDLFSSPGMNLGRTIYIRLTDIRHRLWEDMQSWLSKNDILTEIIFSKYGNPKKWQLPFPEFEKIVEKYSEIVLYHEIAEQEIKDISWNEIIKSCNEYKTERILRGIKDFVADFSVKGPIYQSIKNYDRELLSLYFISMGPYQKKIIKNVLIKIKELLKKDLWNEIEEIRAMELEKWENISKKITEFFKFNNLEKVKSFADKIFKGDENGENDSVY